MDPANDLSRYFSSTDDRPSSGSDESLFSNMNSQSVLSHFRFPSYRNILWDRKPVGDLIVDISVERFLPVVVIPVHILEQLYQYTQMPVNEWSGALLGRYKFSDDSYVFAVDKFSSQRLEKTGSDLIDIQTGEMCISSVVRCAINDLQSDDFPSISLFIRIFCQFGKQADVCSLHGHIVVPTSTLRFIQIKPLRILNNPLGEALQKGNLSLPLNSVFQFGYLTLDQVRNAVPLQYNDALAFKWPLIGIWIYGQESDAHLQSVHVWASCMRFLYNDRIQDRVSPEPMTFLVLIVHPGPHNAVFYECQATPSDNLLKLYNFGMASIYLDSQTRSEISFRWSFGADDGHQSEFQSSLNNCGSIEYFQDYANIFQPTTSQEPRDSRRSASVPPLQVNKIESSCRGLSAETRSKSVSPPNVIATSVASSVGSFQPEHLRSIIPGSAAESIVDICGRTNSHETLNFDLIEASTFSKPSSPARQHQKNETLLSTNNNSVESASSAASSSSSENSFHSQTADNFPVTKGLSNDLRNISERDQNNLLLQEYSALSPLQLLEYQRRQFELLQEQVNSLRESVESRFRNFCCCHSATARHAAEAHKSQLLESLPESAQSELHIVQSSSTPETNRLKNVAPVDVLNSRLQNMGCNSTADTSRLKDAILVDVNILESGLQNMTSESVNRSLVDVINTDHPKVDLGSTRKESSLDFSDAHSIRSSISSNRTSSRSSSCLQVNNDCELKSVSVDIKLPSIQRAHSGSDSTGPDQSFSSHGDSKVVDSVSECSWSSGDRNGERKHLPLPAESRSNESYKSPSRSELVFELAANCSSDNDIVDIPRIQFVSLEESSEDELDEISRRYLVDKFGCDIVSEDTNAGTSHISKYLLHFPDKT